LRFVTAKLHPHHNPPEPVIDHRLNEPAVVEFSYEDPTGHEVQGKLLRLLRQG